MDGDFATGEVVPLSASDAHHVTNVLRLTNGAPLVVVSKVNLQAFASTLIVDTNGEASALIGTPLETAIGDLKKHSHILVAIPKSDLPEWITEKATELGVTSISFFQGDRSVVKLKTAADTQKKQRRLEAVAEAASKQSKRTTIPSVAVIESLEAAIRELPTNTHLISCSLDPDASPLHQITPSAVTDYALVIGAEGDFSAAETDLLKKHNADRLSLGRLTLRVETAAICALAQTALLWQSVKN